MRDDDVEVNICQALPGRTSEAGVHLLQSAVDVVTSGTPAQMMADLSANGLDVVVC